MPGTLHKLVRLARVCAAFAAGLTEVVVKRPATREARADWLSRFCQAVLRAIDVQWSVRGPVPRGGAVISNHLTYLDVLVHAATHPCVFISKIENRRLPLIGWISDMAGTVYVERGQGGSAERAAVQMAEAFRDGVTITYFPEGGTFVGDDPLMPFRSGLLANTLAAHEPVYPSYLVYTLSAADKADGRSERKDIHWGDQSLGHHIWNVLGLRGFHAELTFAPTAVAFSPEAVADRKIAAVEAHEAVLAVAPHNRT